MDLQEREKIINSVEKKEPAGREGFSEEMASELSLEGRVADEMWGDGEGAF